MISLKGKVAIVTGAGRGAAHIEAAKITNGREHHLFGTAV
jgi:hypothetical protein